MKVPSCPSARLPWPILTVYATDISTSKTCSVFLNRWCFHNWHCFYFQMKLSPIKWRQRGCFKNMVFPPSLIEQCSLVIGCLKSRILWLLCSVFRYRRLKRTKKLVEKEPLKLKKPSRVFKTKRTTILLADRWIGLHTHLRHSNSSFQFVIVTGSCLDMGSFSRPPIPPLAQNLICIKRCIVLTWKKNQIASDRLNRRHNVLDTIHLNRDWSKIDVLMCANTMH